MFCDKVKEFLSHKGVEHIERDIALDQSALIELEMLGILTTPVTSIDGEVVVGFDKGKLERLLAQ
jgi:glutaredoxin 3